MSDILKKENNDGNITVGSIIEVTVKNCVEFGVFIEYGTHKGLIHISEIANEYVRKPSDYFLTNKTVKAEVIKINDDKTLSLSTKQFDLKPINKTFTNSYSNNNKRYNKF